MAETEAAKAVDAEAAARAAEAATLAANGAVAAATVAAADAQHNAAEKVALTEERFSSELNKYGERFSTWQQEVNQSLSASQQATAERLAKLETDNQALATGLSTVLENLKLLTPQASQTTVTEVETLTPEQVKEKDEADRKAAQTNQKKQPIRRRI